MRSVHASPTRRAFRKLKRQRMAMIGFWVLVALYIAAVFAPFIAPYNYDSEQRQHPYAPPTRLGQSGELGWTAWVTPNNDAGDDVYFDEAHFNALERRRAQREGKRAAKVS